MLCIFDNTGIQVEEFIDNDSKISNYIISNKIKGWIGSVAKPKDLSKDGNGAFVIAYMNNKIADENIFKNKLDARLASQYIVGEIHVDFLDTDDDPITSSRQGLDESNDEVKKIIDNMDKVRKKFISIWDDFRVKDAVNTLPERIKNNENYKEWLNGLTDDEKKINNKLLNLFSAKLNDDSEIWDKEVDAMVTSIANVVNNIGINEINNEINEAQGNTESVFRLMSKFMQKIAKAEQIQTADIVNYRLKAIDRLEKLMDNPESAEKVFQEHLYDNPWLINPFWNYDNSDVNFKRVREQYFKIINDSNQTHRNFIDILIKVAEEKYPVIVELKKNKPTGHAKIEYEDISKQIKKYRKALIQNLTTIDKKDIKDSDIPAIFIISEDTSNSHLNTIIINSDEQLLIKMQNIQIYTYAQLLENAKNMYKEFINVIKKRKIIPNLS